MPADVSNIPPPKTNNFTRYHIQDNCVYIDYIYSDAPGSGMQTIRELVKLSLASGFDGNIKLEAFDSSHIFHLYMGMIPDLSILDRQEAEKVSFIQEIFAPGLLNILESNIGNARPDTSLLGNVPMILSSAGKTRWKGAIESDKPFEPFRDFSHLSPYFTQEQIGRLKQIWKNTFPKPETRMKNADTPSILSSHSMFASKIENTQLVTEKSNTSDPNLRLSTEKFKTGTQGMQIINRASSVCTLM